MGKLHELLAVESDKENIAKTITQDTKVLFQKKNEHFMGAHRELESFTEGENVEGHMQHMQMTTTVADRLEWTNKHLADYFDVVLKKECTNQTARHDLVVNGVVIAKDVPATFLLGLEKKLKGVREFYALAPTLPPGQEWKEDPDRGKNVHMLTHPDKKFRTAKTFKHQVLYDATDKHPAQIEKWEETVNVGVFVTKRWSGMLTSAKKEEYLTRIDEMTQSVKIARQKANQTEVKEEKIGEKIFKYIMT